MKLIMMWLWTTTWYYKKHHETTCKTTRHFLPTTQPSVSYFKWLWWICSNDASNAGVDAVGKPSRRVAPIASSPGKVITAPGVTPVMRKALKSGYLLRAGTPIRFLSRQYKYGKLYPVSEGFITSLSRSISKSSKSINDDARFHRHSVEVATCKRNQYQKTV